jgi:hypothetical protein
MRAFHCAILFCVSATAWGAADEPPVTFARGGQKMTLLAPEYHRWPGTPILFAYGRVWAKAVMEKDGAMVFQTPQVRVPVVFQVVSLTEDGTFRGLPGAAAFHAPPGEVIVYPDRPIPWEKKLRLVAVGAADWFQNWSNAVGLPVQTFKDLKSLRTGKWQVPEKPALVILGGGVFADGPSVAGEYKVNTLTLDKDWRAANERIVANFAVLPKCMGGPLADLASQSWPLPPRFSRRALEVMNRQTWIAGPEHPLVEEIRSPSKGSESFRAVVSYLPWQRQLGRSGVADELFLRVLSEAARGAKGRPPLDGRWLLLYPPAKTLKAEERPVLAAASKSRVPDGVSQGQKTHAYVLDLRGKTPPPADFFGTTESIRTAEARVGERTPLLILGDSPLLDHWKWLKLDRPHGCSPRPGVVWRPDSSLPPSMDSQLRLMQFFTEWNISLGELPREVRNEDRKDES